MFSSLAPGDHTAYTSQVREPSLFRWSARELTATKRRIRLLGAPFETGSLPGLLVQPPIGPKRQVGKVRLTVCPERVEEVSPAGAVVSIVTLDPSKVDVSSLEEIYENFCEQIYFFASREEAERWIAGRETSTFCRWKRRTSWENTFSPMCSPIHSG